MKKYFFGFLLSLCLLKGSSQDNQTNFIEKTFELGDFKLENNIILPNAYIKYVTYGTLNNNKSNAILLPSWFGSDYNGYNFLIGKNKALDTSKYFLILTELFANGHSSSPSNTSSPFHGKDFPSISILDNVKAQMEIVAGKFKISKLKSVIGFSMGAQQAFQWASYFPQSVESIVAYCGTAKTYPHGYARLESAIAAIQADVMWNDGAYDAPPKKGLKAWALHWASWFLSPQWYRLEKFKQLGFATVDDFLNTRIKKESNTEVNDIISQTKTWEKHDIANNAKFNGDIKKALSSIQCKVLYMPSESDMYFPLADAVYEKQFISSVSFMPIPSDWGHLAGSGLSTSDNSFLNTAITNLLSQLK